MEGFAVGLWISFMLLLTYSHTLLYFSLHFSGVFELNFMANQPASGYYQFTVAVTGDSRLVANHVEASFHE